MMISGLQKMTLLDFPGKVACTVFTGGCNFRCPFCHNALLVLGADSLMSEDELLAFLEKRRGVLEGVAITGGEPLIHNDIASLILRIRALGYKIKLDTNGSFPERLAELIGDGLLDYIAMDIKNSPEKYAGTAGVRVLRLDDIIESIGIIVKSGVEYEFRTTVVRELHDADSIRAAAAMIAGAKRYFIQSYKDSGDIIASGYSACSRAELEALLAAAKDYVPNAELRGVD